MQNNIGNFFIIVMRTHRYNGIKLYKIIVNAALSAFNNRDFQKTTIMDKIFETNSTNHVK